MQEQKIEAYLRDRVKALGGRAYKWVSPGNDGVPDRIVVLDGQMYPVELKSPGKVPTKLQLVRHAELARMGCPVAVLSSMAAVDGWLASLPAGGGTP